MSKNLENTENTLQDKNQYLYGGFQRISSYDPNMCTTAARFSPFYGKNNTTQPKENPQMMNTNLIYKLVQSANEEVSGNDSSNNIDHTDDTSKIVYPTYLTHSNEMLIEQQNPESTVFVENQLENRVAFDAKQQDPSVLCDGVGIDYVQQINHGIGEVTEEPLTSGIVLHRSPNGHLYQNFYVTNEEETPGEVVELVPIDVCSTSRFEEIEGESYVMQPYEFPTECNMEAFETHPPMTNEEENHGQMLAAQMLEREQQRILLESTMSPLLAAVNDVTQRDAELLSYLNQHVEKDRVIEETNVHEKDEYSNGFDDRKRDSSEEDDDYILVSDKPIESRAIASLPTNYLYLGNINADTNEPSVFAKKLIPHKTKFGPFEGETRFTSDVFLNILRSQQPRHYPLLLVGKSRILIVTNENTSNWMRFVRLAQFYSEQNLQIIEEDDRIYFKCNRDIRPKEELRVGYHTTYADKYNLPNLEPSMEDSQKKYELDNPWMCFECDQRFSTSQDMQSHLEVHDVEDASCIISKRKIKRKQNKIKKLSELPRNSSRCVICFKVFMTNASLKKHFATQHFEKKSKPKGSVKLSERSPYKCSLCYKKFSSDEKLKSHEQTHLGGEEKPHKCLHCDQHYATPTALAAHIRSHTNRLYSCVYCQQTFKYVLNFKQHFELHCIDGMYPCIHCKKKYKEYRLVRKHVRIFHPAVKYPCNECDRLFLHMSFLRRHKATHAKKNLQCTECAKQFQKKRELKQHLKSAAHKVKRKRQTLKKKNHIEEYATEYLQDIPKKEQKKPPPKVNPTPTDDYHKLQFKCEDCKVGFKRRGMLVNHMAKKHPGQSIDSIEVLNQPIIKLQSVFNCPHCSKVYKNNAKRKLHILKNHPGMELPPSFRSNSLLNDANVQTVGCIKADVQKCHLCYKQYASRTRLQSHYRKFHSSERIPENSPGTLFPPTQMINQEQNVEPMMNIYRPPASPENKLLKLSSAALELSSIEDRKYFDFLNERTDTTDIVDGNRSNYKIVENEFGETSSNTELNRLPELFEESIACI